MALKKVLFVLILGLLLLYSSPLRSSQRDKTSEKTESKEVQTQTREKAEQSKDKVDRTKEKVDTKSNRADTGDEAERARRAANVLNEMINTPDSRIPRELLDRAHAIAVIPHVVKAALGIGGSHGKGLVAQRIGTAWSTPVFVSLSGGDYGLQLGVSATDLILIFTNEEGLKALLDNKLELGVNASVAAGPVGRTAEAGTNVTLDSAIYSYSRSKGLFAGISLKGAVMTFDDEANRKVYAMTAKDLLGKRDVAASPVVKPFTEALQKYAPQKRQA